jgi:hypothetical protein
MHLQDRPSCPDCDLPVDRRHFLRTVGSAALAGAAAPALLGGRPVSAAPSPKSTAETAVVRFYNSLTEAQKKSIVFPFDHELRKKISANWHVTSFKIDDDFYTKDQRAIIDEIIRGVTTEDGYQRIIRQTEDDDGGIGGYSVAVFGTPGSGKFEWELTGRHLTLRADGDSVDKAAFGGPIIYGHGVPEPSKNLFHYQTEQANEVFRALNSSQAEKALIKVAPKEDAVALQGEQGTFPGITVGELARDQKELVEKTLKVILAPYRKEDVDEVFEILKAAGGVDKLHMAFYQQEDLRDDKEWDIWRVEGPSLVWHFRGAPHVHAYINIGIKS